MAIETFIGNDLRWEITDEGHTSGPFTIRRQLYRDADYVLYRDRGKQVLTDYMFFGTLHECKAYAQKYWDETQSKPTAPNSHDLNVRIIEHSDRSQLLTKIDAAMLMGWRIQGGISTRTTSSPGAGSTDHGCIYTVLMVVGGD